MLTPTFGWAILFCVLSAVLGYLLGSLNFAIITTRLLFKEDIRKKGSGNAGSTNVLRTYGIKGAAFTLAGDIGKGFLSVFVGRLLFTIFLPGMVWIYGGFLAGIGAVLGHLFPLYFGFKGGKGVSVAGGVILAIQPLLALPMVLIFLVTLGITGMVSLGSILGISFYPTLMLLYVRLSSLPNVFCTVCAAIVSILVIFMHRSNIKRIWDGTEYRFGSRFKDANEKSGAVKEDTEVKETPGNADSSQNNDTAE